ncbi:MAG: CoA pyrophosphatase [Saprospiraceae bacterium]|nr:CoA pyrophosphatase [Saprospiraceae bacterium]
MLPDFLQQIKDRLNQPLPGREVQYEMASLRRIQELTSLSFSAPDDAKIACVLILTWPDASGNWATALIQRTSNPNDRHSGQISFPGGRYEPDDPSLEHVALREAQEEIGIAPDQVAIIGRLTELYIPVSNFLVHPFVGWTPREPSFVLQAGEVERILTPTLSWLRQPQAKKATSIQIGSGAQLTNVPFFDVENHVVWGATAMIINELLAILPD